MLTENTNVITSFACGLIESYEKDESMMNNLYQVNTLTLSMFKDNVQLTQMFCDYLVSKEEKLTAIDQMSVVGNYPKYYTNTLKLFIESGLFPYIYQLLEDINNQLLKVLEIKKVYVSSSIRLSDKQKTILEDKWTKKLNKKTMFFYNLDPSLIVGIKVQVDDHVDEWSFNSHLSNVNKMVKT